MGLGSKVLGGISRALGTKGDVHLPNESGRVDPRLAARGITLTPFDRMAHARRASRDVRKRLRSFTGSRQR